MEFLKQIPIFQSLDDDSLKKINECIESKQIIKGKTLFFEGDPGDAFYILRKGIVGVIKKIDGKEQKVAELSEGDFFGEMALIEGEPRNATVMCETDCELLVISKEKFDTLLKVNLSISIRIMKVISQRFKGKQAKAEESREGKIISVCSPRGGCGRSMLISNLGAVLASRGHSCVILDYDLQFGDQALMFNIMHSSSLSDLVQNEQSFSAEIVEKYLEKTHIEKLFLLAAPATPEEAELVSRQAAFEILSSLKSKFEYILIDTSTYFSDVNLSAFDQSDMILLLCEVDLAGIKNSRAAYKLLENLNYSTEKIKLVVSKVGKNKGITLENISNSFSRPVYGELPYSTDDCVGSLNRGLPLFSLAQDCPYSVAVSALCTKIAGETPAPAGIVSKIFEGIKNVYGSVAKWQKAKELEPKYAGAYYNLGLAYKAKGMIDEAIEEYRAALKLNPGYADCHYYLGMAYMEKGVFEDASSCFREALKINPKYKESSNMLGVALIKGGKLTEARKVLEDLITEYPHFADSMNYLGKACLMLKEYDYAEEMLKKSLEINPRYLEARYNLASVLEARKMIKEAIEEYQRIISEGSRENPYVLLSRERISVLTA